MHINVTQSGGFAGSTITLASTALEQLPPEAADQIRRHVEALTRAAAAAPRTAGADRFEYHVEIAEPGAAPRTITVVDEGDENDPKKKAVAAILELLNR
jgi:hypothetical protein